MNSHISEVIGSFFNYLSELDNINDYIYNEISLQFELGCYLRYHLSGNYSIQFEQPVNKLFNDYQKYNFVKKEIDLVINDNVKKTRFYIELKFPKNGQYPVQMYKFCEDVRFLEQLNSADKNECCFICLVDDYLFYKGKLTEGIYGVFRKSESNPSYGHINNTIDQYYSEKPLNIQGNYNFDWSSIAKHENYRYMTVHIK